MLPAFWEQIGTCVQGFGGQGFGVMGSGWAQVCLPSRMWSHAWSLLLQSQEQAGRSQWQALVRQNGLPWDHLNHSDWGKLSHTSVARDLGDYGGQF